MTQVLIVIAEMRQIAGDIRRLQRRLFNIGLVSVSVMMGAAAQKVEVKIEETLR